MTFYFSAERVAFYNAPSNTTTVPTPAGFVKITDAAYHELMYGQSNGKKIASDENGYPILIEREKPSIEYQWEIVKQRRDVLLLETDWTQLPDVPIETTEKYKSYRQQLRDITLQPDPFNIVWPIKPE